MTKQFWVLNNQNNRDLDKQIKPFFVEKGKLIISEKSKQAHLVLVMTSEEQWLELRYNLAIEGRFKAIDGR